MLPYLANGVMGSLAPSIRYLMQQGVIPAMRNETRLRIFPYEGLRLLKVSLIQPL